MTASACPCGSGELFAACCRRWHAGADAPTPESLMRSRYSAFAVGDTEYLRRTWYPSTRPRRLDLDTDRRWTGLVVHATTGGGLFENTGEVEFTASYDSPAGSGAQRERSRFVREAGAWFYLDGV